MLKTNDGKEGGLLNGKPHYDKNGNPLGGIKAVVTDDGNRPVELEGSEAILKRSAMESDKEFIVKGTPKEIASTLNQAFGGRPIGDEEAEIIKEFGLGGDIPKEKHIYLGKEGGTNVSSISEFERAVDLEKQGFSNEEIRQKTGWFRNEFDNLWRYEISDNGMEVILDFDSEPLKKLKQLDKSNYCYNVKLKDVINHKKLFKAYPKIKELNVNLHYSEKNPVASVYVGNNGKINISLNLEADANRIFTDARDEREKGHTSDNDRRKRNIFRKILCHEIQHCVQIKEGMSKGTSFDVQLKKVQLETRGNENVSEEEQRRIAKKRLDNNSGEIEAMSSSDRLDLSEIERIKHEPYSSVLIDYDYFNLEYEDTYEFKHGGEIKPDFSKMSKAEIKEFYNSPEGEKLDSETYAEWKSLVNMTKTELKDFYDSKEGKEAGLSPSEAKEQGIDSGRESARWIMKMKDIPYTEWTDKMWIWAKKQIRFIKRMSGVKGNLYDENGIKTPKHTALLIWGHNPEKMEHGGDINDNNMDEIKGIIEEFGLGGGIEIEVPKYAIIDDEQFEVIGINYDLDKVRVKSFTSGETFEMPIEKWIIESFELGTPAKFKANGKEYSGEIVMRDGQKSISLYNDENYSGDMERVIPIREIDISTLKPTMKKEMFEDGGGIEFDMPKEEFVNQVKEMHENIDEVILKDGTHIDGEDLMDDENNVDSVIIEYFKPYKSVEELAELHNVPVKEIVHELHLGEKTELEHTDNYKIARTIALQHLEESPKYYTLLEGMESNFELGGGIEKPNRDIIEFKPITTPL